jgi:hypothetical protein
MYLRVALSLYVLHSFGPASATVVHHDLSRDDAYLVLRIPDPCPSNHLSTQVACINYTGLIVPVQVHNVHNAVYVSLKAGPNKNWNNRSLSDEYPKTPYNHDIHLLLPPAPLSLSTIVIEMGSFSETSDEKLGHVPIDSKQLDTGAQLDASLHTQLDPGESLRIRSV